MNVTVNGTFDLLAGVVENDTIYTKVGPLPGIGYELEDNVVIHIITLALTAIGVLIYIPFTIYIAYPLFAQRNDIILQKRYVKLSLLAVTFEIISVITLTTYQLFVFRVIHDDTSTDHMGESSDESHDYQAIDYVEFVLQCIIAYCTSSFICIMFVRFWFIYYETNYNVLMANDKWKSVIDNTYNTNNNFFIKNKATFGNQKWLMKWAYADMALGFIITPIIVETGVGWIGMIVMILFYIAFFFIYMKLKRLKFYDEFHILEEFRVLGITLSVIILIWILLAISTIILMQIDQHKLNNTITITVYMFLYFQVSICYDIWCIYVMTRWVIKKIENDPSIQQQYNTYSMKLFRQLPNSNSNASTELTNIDLNGKRVSGLQNKELKSIKLEEILINSEYFTSFMKHLSAEYSMELLLSLVELIQFKQMIFEQLSDDKKDDDGIVKINLAKCVPKSTIVYGNDELKIKALKLYRKYIQIGCEYEINIHSGLRKQLMGLFQSAETSNGESIEWNKNVLYKCFDECSTEMMKLLGYSLTRFKTKSEYVRLQTFKK
eukprot:527808_1